MEEIKIGDLKEENELNQKEKHQIKDLQPEETNQEDPEEESRDGRSIFIMVLIMAGVFIVLMGGFKAYDYFTGADIINLDYLHQMNLEGKLDESRGYVYNGYSFVKFDGLWWTQIQHGDVLIKIPLHFGPKDLSEIRIEGSLDTEAFNQGENVYIAIDPEYTDKFYTLALSEMNFNIVKGIERHPIAACIKENEICEDREILSCSDTQNKPVIELRYDNESKVTFDGSCILIQGNDYGIVKAANRIILKWYGMMD